MKQILKRMLVIVCLISLLLFTSCSENVWTIEGKIEQTGKEVIKAIIDEDDKNLLELFASDIQDNRKEETLEEIRQAFDFIYGKIVSYDYHQDGGERRKSHGDIDYYYRLLEFRNVTTDLDNIYTIYIDYIYIWDEQPEREGINQIRIFKNSERDNDILVGTIYIRDE